MYFVKGEYGGDRQGSRDPNVFIHWLTAPRAPAKKRHCENVGSSPAQATIPEMRRVPLLPPLAAGIFWVSAGHLLGGFKSFASRLFSPALAQPRLHSVRGYLNLR